MPFYPCHARSSNASLMPLIRLLDDFDSYSRQVPQQRVFLTPVKSFRPRFDVREVEDAYELVGELAGVSRENLHIEFTDPRTLRVHGHVERSYTSGAAQESASEEAQPETVADSVESAEKSKQDSRQPTVEDEDDFENIETPDNSTARAESEVTAEETPKTEAPQEKKPADKARYWLSERGVGQFSRTFTFPVQLRQDAVTANLNEGILSIRIPKTPEHEGRRHIQLA